MTLVVCLVRPGVHIPKLGGAIPIEVGGGGRTTTIVRSLVRVCIGETGSHDYPDSPDENGFLHRYLRPGELFPQLVSLGGDLEIGKT